ncbi:MAG: hypothetical protein NVSMB21_12320 [Vulcanimicrobiaceae bacterium]
MTIGVRAAALTVAVATIAIGFAAFALRLVLHARLGAYAADFAMMRSMMGDGPNLPQIFGELDRTIATALAVSACLAIIAGIGLGATLSRAFRAVNRGLGLFAQGRLDVAIRERGPVEIRRVARNANAMAARLAASRTAERELVAGVVHDLAHPITALRATIDAVRAGLLDARDASVFRRMAEAIATLERTTDDLRDVGAWQTGTLALERGPVDVEDLARHVEGVYADFATRRGVHLRVDARPLTAYSDMRRLERLVDNLVVNAIAATPSGGAVRFGAERRDGEIVLTVRDEAGDAGAARLRAALERGDGDGLGIRVVRAMANALEARLTVESETTGSTVIVALGRDANVVTTRASSGSPVWPAPSQS